MPSAPRRPSGQARSVASTATGTASKSPRPLGTIRALGKPTPKNRSNVEGLECRSRQVSRIQGFCRLVSHHHCGGGAVVPYQSRIGDRWKVTELLICGYRCAPIASAALVEVEIHIKQTATLRIRQGMQHVGVQRRKDGGVGRNAQRERDYKGKREPPFDPQASQRLPQTRQQMIEPCLPAFAHDLAPLSHRPTSLRHLLAAVTDFGCHKALDAKCPSRRYFSNRAV